MDGKKTYLAGAAMIISGIGLILKGFSDGTGINTEALNMVMSGFGIMFLRHAVAKVQ